MRASYGNLVPHPVSNMTATSQSAKRPVTAIIMAAGQGKRMGSGDLPKVVYPVADRPMVCWVVQEARKAGADRVIVIVGYKKEQVIKALDGMNCEFAEQKELLGTGHAVAQAADLYKNHPASDAFVLAGDGPLIRAQTLLKLLEVHRKEGAAATLATAILDNPTGYGRVIRNASGKFDRIVEQKDAKPQELACKEVNPSYYLFDSALLFEFLPLVKNSNAQAEYYLTDVPGLLKAKGHTVSLVDAVPAEDVLSINNLEHLAEVDKIFRSRTLSNPGKK
jgi:bifunctional UDP-N-acetylglucosamine pyrophosphorylase / glucosamine-1-phosphate N-acetyltransferase